MTKKPKKDINETVLNKMGFKRKSFFDDVESDELRLVSRWVNDLGITIITGRREKASLKRLVERIIDSTAIQTRNEIFKEVSSIDFGKTGFNKLP